MKRRLRAPSPSLAISLLALFVALGGTAYAAVSLPKNSVGTKQLKKGAVRTNKIKNGAVGTAKIKNGAVTAGKIAGDAVTNEKVAADAITTEKIADNAVTQPKVAADSIGAAQFKDLVVRTSNVSIPTGGSNYATADCLAGEQVIGGGTSWGSFGPDRYTNYVHILGNGVQARGNQFTGSAQTFIVEAYCLPN